MPAPCIGFDADQDCSAVADRAVEIGVAFVCRYYKNLAPQEARNLSAAGLKIVSIWETTAGRALGGGSAGFADGRQALTMAQAIQQPLGSAIYATVDFGEAADQNAAVLAYLASFRAAITNNYKLGVYGEGAVCQAALDAGTADYAWLAAGRLMRGTQDFIASGRAAIIQDVGDAQDLHLGGGIDIDTDTAYAEDYGGWQI